MGACNEKLQIWMTSRFLGISNADKFNIFSMLMKVVLHQNTLENLCIYNIYKIYFTYIHNILFVCRNVYNITFIYHVFMMYATILSVHYFKMLT